MTKERSTKIVNFIPPGGRVSCAYGDSHLCHIVKMHYLFRNLFILKHRSDKLNISHIVIMTKEMSTKIVNSITSGTWVLVLGRGKI